MWHQVAGAVLTHPSLTALAVIVLVLVVAACLEISAPGPVRGPDAVADAASDRIRRRRAVPYVPHSPESLWSPERQRVIEYIALERTREQARAERTEREVRDAS